MSPAPAACSRGEADRQKLATLRENDALKLHNICFHQTSATPSPKAEVTSASALAADVVKVRDEYFELAEISSSGELSWKLRGEVTAENAIKEMNVVNLREYGKSLLPEDRAWYNVTGYDTKEGSRQGQAVFGVVDSDGKDGKEMRDVLKFAQISFSTRYNSLVSLNLFLLLRGKHPLEGGRTLRDKRGFLFASENGLSTSRLDDSRHEGDPLLSALGSRKRNNR